MPITSSLQRATAARSARRQTVRARCKVAAPAAPPRQDKLLQRTQFPLQRVDLIPQSIDLRSLDPAGALGRLISLEDGKIRTEIEEIILNQAQLFSDILGELSSESQANESVQFIGSAESLDSQRVLRHHLATSQARVSPIALAGGNPGDPHGPLRLLLRTTRARPR